MFLYEKIQSFGLDAVSAVGEIGFLKNLLKYVGQPGLQS